jgi:hypothetical protein
MYALLKATRQAFDDEQAVIDIERQLSGGAVIHPLEEQGAGLPATGPDKGGPGAASQRCLQNIPRRHPATEEGSLGGLPGGR